jgi:hypothetical protein
MERYATIFEIHFRDLREPDVFSSTCSDECARQCARAFAAHDENVIFVRWTSPIGGGYESWEYRARGSVRSDEQRDLPFE